MKIDRFLDNMVEQIKEAQLKLGFEKEEIRLYFPAESLCSLLELPAMAGEELLELLEKEDAFSHTKLGPLSFSCRKNRMEVRISPSGVAYVHEKVPDPPFLFAIIRLFQEHHSLSIEKIRSLFENFNPDYVCEQMEPGTDFDYVLYFPDHTPDSWYYCIRMEMGHTIYHRFTEEDYRSLLL